jgi:hypothetical protein
MVSAAVCQISILDEYVINSPSYIEIGTRSSVYASSVIIRIFPIMCENSVPPEIFEMGEIGATELHCFPSTVVTRQFKHVIYKTEAW